MQHAFESNETVTDARHYCTKKLFLYREPCEENEDLVVRRLHAGLDAT